MKIISESNEPGAKHLIVYYWSFYMIACIIYHILHSKWPSNKTEAVTNLWQNLSKK